MHKVEFNLVHPRRCIWLKVVGDYLISISGRSQCIWRHDLLACHSNDKKTTSFSVEKLPDLLKPKRFSSKHKETKDCHQACISKSLKNDHIYLCAALRRCVM